MAVANGGSGWPSISADGRFVAFLSGASNFVPGDTNKMGDVFVRDLATGKTERVSVSSADKQAKGDSSWAAISADARFVAFSSAASNLVARDTNKTYDVFVRDRVTGKMTRASVGSGGKQANGTSGAYGPRILRLSCRHYNDHRPHRALDRFPPNGRHPTSPKRARPPTAWDLLGALIHEYQAA